MHLFVLKWQIHLNLFILLLWLLFPQKVKDLFKNVINQNAKYWNKHHVYNWCYHFYTCHVVLVHGLKWEISHKLQVKQTNKQTIHKKMHSTSIFETLESFEAEHLLLFQPYVYVQSHFPYVSVNRPINFMHWLCVYSRVSFYMPDIFILHRKPAAQALSEVLPSGTLEYPQI